MKDPKTEDFMTRGGWKWHYVKNVPFTEIDFVASLANPSRLVRDLDDDRVLNMGIAMESGIEFPAIVLLNIDPGEKRAFKWEIATGCHRVSAAEIAKKTSFDAYIVTEPDNYRREVLIRQLNTIEGVAPSLQDTMRQICHLHKTYKVPLAQLAKEWNVKLPHLQSCWNEELAIERARRFGYDQARYKISRKALLVLQGIHSDVVFEKAIHFAMTSGANTVEIELLAREIKKTRDEKAGLDVIARNEKAITERNLKTRAKHGRVSPAGAQKLRNNCRLVVTQLEEGIDKLHLSAYPQPSDLKIMISETIELLKKVHLELDRIERMSHIRSGDQPGAMH